MSLPDMFPKQYPLPEHILIDQGHVTSSGLVHEIGFYGGSIGTRINSRGLALSVVALSSVGASYEQVQTWYAGTPYEDRIDDVYQGLNMTSAEGVERRIGYAWRAGHLTVARQVKLPLAQHKKMQVIPTSVQQILSGLASNVPRERIDAWATDQGLNVETVLTDFTDATGLQNSAAAISFGFATRFLKSQGGVVTIHGEKSPPDIQQSIVIPMQRTESISKTEQAVRQNPKLFERPLGPRETVFSSKGCRDLRIDTDAMTTSVQLGDAVITFDLRNAAPEELGNITQKLLGVSIRTLANSTNHGGFAKAMKGHLQGILPDKTYNNSETLLIDMINEGLVTISGKTHHAVPMTDKERQVFAQVKALKTMLDIVNHTTGHSTGTQAYLRKIRTMLDARSHEELLLIAQSSDVNTEITSKRYSSTVRALKSR